MKYRLLDAGELTQKGDEILDLEEWRSLNPGFPPPYLIKQDYNQYPHEHVLLMAAEGMCGVAEPNIQPHRRDARLPKTPANPFTGKLLRCGCMK